MSKERERDNLVRSAEDRVTQGGQSGIGMKGGQQASRGTTDNK